MLITRTSLANAVANGQRLYASFKPAPKLNELDLNPNVIAAEYAVRGPIPARAEELRAILQTNPSSLPFSTIINANIGNPQQLDQQPLTWYRQVLSLLQNPMLLKAKHISDVYPQDVVNRAEDLLSSIGSVGAYSGSQGVQLLRESVADFIFRRDGHEASADDIFLTGGASAAVTYLLTAICSGPDSGVLIPIPQYPLYTATLALNNATPLPYYLEESKGWSTNPDEIREVIVSAISRGIKPKALVVINPGNPTGAILSYDNIADIITVAAEYGVMVIADEVYQENVFRGEFVSMRRVFKDLQAAEPELYANVLLASLHSTSKGFSGECGQRGGYMELVNFSEPLKAAITKLTSINLCPTVTGQALIELMINPPRDADGESTKVYNQERDAIMVQLKSRSQALYDAFCKMEGVECQLPEGAMYLFPKITIPQKAQDKAKELNVAPDAFYCAQLLEHTGICTVPGSGFGQVEGTFHVRTTFLVPGTEWVQLWENFHKQFMDEFRG
ncbi:hypothetical protein BABINDRAFT_159620 [Babjeviella inositovora NRRL Y-12698]|uniref:Glutamate pyruvate transaminase n=1 Tax=Babjeviella inositovora NRRL Y-12698 TaxID=984486 RepID=A0A1E3QZR2_9ASCO|nr:uncharacterized protein BABINDRAFT_159620 [Babjeviella inositovora NRRL Y-12698]ODQ83179.1 hypothetical protein BABINDRAFT_159620 [Babjeviella inositovora NRRL Y-12698]